MLKRLVVINNPLFGEISILLKTYYKKQYDSIEGTMPICYLASFGFSWTVSSSIEEPHAAIFCRRLAMLLQDSSYFGSSHLQRENLLLWAYCCWNYFIVMGISSWKGLLWLSLPEGNDRIFLNWHHLLRELLFWAEATEQRRHHFCSPVNFCRMCWFLNLAVPYS